MERFVFDSTQPTGTMSLDNLRTNFKALFMMDMLPLRVRACATPNMSVIVDACGDASAYFDHVYIGSAPLTFVGGATPSVSAPATNPRIDLVKIDATGSLGIITGAEAVAPVVQWGSLASDEIPLALLYCKAGMSSIVDYEDKDANTTEGYIYKDVRPFLNLGKANFIDLTDTPGAYTNGYFLKMNASSVIGASMVLDDLTDTDVGSPTNLQLLQYVTASGKWQSATVIDTNTALGTSDTVTPSQKATKTYADTKIPKTDIDTTTTLGTSDTKVPSQKAVKTYVDGKSGIEVFTADGTFTAKTTQIFVTAVGGGGGAGRTTSSTGSGGGGAGQTVLKYPLTVVAGNSYAVVVGAGGAGGTGAPSDGTAGGASTFNSTSVVALGGSGGGGASSAGGLGGGRMAGIGVLDGTAGGAGSFLGGGNGGNGGAISSGGGGGSTPFGAGGAGRNTNGTGISGTGYGSGGGGCPSGYNGGNGTSGIVIIEW